MSGYLTNFSPLKPNRIYARTQPEFIKWVCAVISNISKPHKLLFQIHCKNVLLKKLTFSQTILTENGYKFIKKIKNKDFGAKVMIIHQNFIRFLWFQLLITKRGCELQKNDVFPLTKNLKSIS